MSFVQKEQLCELRFSELEPCWHLYTSGAASQIIFVSDDDFRIGINSLAWCTAKFGNVRILTFALMNNHIHLILSGDRLHCTEFFESFRRKISTAYKRSGRFTDFSGFNGNILAIPDLKALRNEIVYVNRNGFVANPQCTPYSYLWGAGIIFFNPLVKHLGGKTPFRQLSIRKKREIAKSKDISLPDNYMVIGGIVLPSCFCAVTEAETLFRDAHQYFSLLSKNYESYSEIAKRLSDTVFMTDSEIYGAVSAYCKDVYKQPYPHLIPAKDRFDVARKMHYDYRASNRQIRSILKIDMSVVDGLFPQSIG